MQDERLLAKLSAGDLIAQDAQYQYHIILSAFCALAARTTPQTIDTWIERVERFVVLLYDRTSSQMYVNSARKELFTLKGRTIDGLPPTKAALVQHIMRAAYQAGHCWGQTIVSPPELPSPSQWGWNESTDGNWEVNWTTLPRLHMLAEN